MVFASLLSAFLGIAIGLPLGIVAGVLLLKGRFLIGGTSLLVAFGLAFCSTIGLLVGLDLWSLFERVL